MPLRLLRVGASLSTTRSRVSIESMSCLDESPSSAERQGRPSRVRTRRCSGRRRRRLAPRWVPRAAASWSQRLGRCRGGAPPPGTWTEPMTRTEDGSMPRGTSNDTVFAQIGHAVVRAALGRVVSVPVAVIVRDAEQLAQECLWWCVSIVRFPPAPARPLDYTPFVIIPVVLPRLPAPTPLRTARQGVGAEPPGVGRSRFATTLTDERSMTQGATAFMTFRQVGHATGYWTRPLAALSAIAMIVKVALHCAHVIVLWCVRTIEPSLRDALTSQTPRSPRAVAMPNAAFCLLARPTAS
jgi:hypothetical protein